MKTLHLTLKKKWFDMILSGEKKEEYREIKPYWNKRFFKCGINCTKSKYYGDCQEIIDGNVVNTFPCHSCEHSYCSDFDTVVFRNGYSKNAPTITVELNYITIDFGHIKLGAPESNPVYILTLGKIVSKRNIS